MTGSPSDDVLLEEQDLRITPAAIETSEDRYRLDAVGGFEHAVSKPFVVPLMLAILGTVNMVIAVQTGFWGDFLAATLMLAGGLALRALGTWHVLRLGLADKPTVAWQTRNAARMQRVVACLEAQGLRRGVKG